MFKRVLDLIRSPAVVALCLLCAAAGAAAAPTAATEYEVKAAYVVNLLMFVTPRKGVTTSAPTGTIDVAILGDDPFGKSFAPVEGRAVDKAGRKLRIHRYRHLDADAIGRCRAVFVARSEASRLEEVLDALRGKPVLTISDIEEFAEQGGMVGLVRMRKRVRWTVNRRAFEEARLIPSAQLLRNAVRVVGRVGERGGKEGQ